MISLLTAQLKKTSKNTQHKLTLVPQCEPAHLWKVFERLKANHSSEHFKADDGDLVLFDEARSYGRLLVGLLVNEAQQSLVTRKAIIRDTSTVAAFHSRCQPAEHNIKLCKLFLHLSQRSVIFCHWTTFVELSSTQALQIGLYY